MFWRTYGLVIWWLLGIGAVAGGAWGFLIFLSFRLAGIGALFGAITAGFASIVYSLVLMIWTRRTRSAASHAWAGAFSAGAGALLFWSVLGYVFGGQRGLGYWGAVGEASAIIAALVAGVATAWAVRPGRDRKQTVHQQEGVE